MSLFKEIADRQAVRHAEIFGGKVGMQNSQVREVSVRLDAAGYAHGVLCQHVHAGNRRLSAPSAGYCQCSGCGNMYAAADIAAEQ